MKIKKLELTGFKSFVDRTVLHFEHDVLAIVGPNGCGKSNIVDAIRWCMGEQSARHLRGRSMDDVIFSGSESRPPNELAEVSLTFENDAPDELPLEYRGYGEIAVTRRLYRTGESEYLINKTAVRLRDVTDMFLGTGAGTKAYAIVEQGKVGLIVSAKPEDRRLLIEEASGITKFKSRKKQAERRMELTHQNLLRVGDIVAEIERSLASLKRQAAKAERFVAYRHELEDLKLHEASHRYLELVGWTKYEGGEVTRLTELHGQARAELDGREAELEAARTRKGGAEQEFDAAQRANIEADTALRAEQAAIARASDRLGALTEREGQAQIERDEMMKQGKRLDDERRALSANLALLESDGRAHAERVASAEAELAKVALEHGDCEARVVEHRQRVAAVRADIARTEGQLAGFQRRESELQGRVDRLESEGQSLEAQRGELEPRASEQREALERLRAERDVAATEKLRLDQLLPSFKERLKLDERALEGQKTELSKRRSRLGALLEVQARLEGVGAGTRALVASRDATIQGLAADRLEAPTHLTQALAGLLGGRLQHVLVADLDRGATLLESLAEEQKGRATVLATPSLQTAGSLTRQRDDALQEQPGVVGWLFDSLRFAPDDENLVRWLVGNALVVQDVATARRLREIGVATAIVTVGGTVWHEDGRIEGGQGDALAAGMLDGKREARELATAVGELEGVVAASAEGLEVVRRELAATGAALDRARLEVHGRELALVAAEKDAQKTDAQLEVTTRRLRSLASERGDIARSGEDLRAEREALAEHLAEARAALENAEANLEHAQSVTAAVGSKLDGERQGITAFKVAAAGTREQLAAARGADVRLAKSLAELEQRATRIAEELLDNARAGRDTAAVLAQHRATLEGCVRIADQAAEVLARARTELDDARAVSAAQESGLKELRLGVSTLREELRVHELAHRERELALEHLVASVGESFRGLHLPRVVGDFHLRPAPDDELRARIEELTRLVERMGSVNLDAVREHAEAEERFAFYSVQRVDLEKALTDLERAIALMNRESRRLFEETFEAVNARFKEVFPRMFRGGRAELKMTTPSDTLETGIDIVAQPPGKRLSSIELMSGGEKALTAVSLIFAIFQIRPSPFCILDEVDAPLDEANVSRYNEIIRSMTDRSQFILITHIKRTMQMVDVLYGVTMPEAGVSKIVSVKMNGTGGRIAAQPEPEIAVA